MPTPSLDTDRTSLASGRDPKPRQLFIGIDPGTNGGMAVLDGRFEPRLIQFETDRGMWQDIELQNSDPGFTPFAVIEKNTGYVGGAGNTGSSMFKFGCSYGKLLMALTAAGIPFEEAMPQVWQRALGIPPRKKQGRKHVESKAQFKRRLKQFAERLFPGVEVTLATCDALLLAEYCRRKRQGELK